MEFDLADKYCFLFKNILKRDPDDAHRFCDNHLNRWKSSLCHCSELAESMNDWTRFMSINLVLASNKFERCFSADGDEKYDTLARMYDNFDGDVNALDLDTAEESDDDDAIFNAEEGRSSDHQRKQHLKALLFLTTEARKREPLTVKLIQDAHKILMEGLHTVKNDKIQGGVYRRDSACADYHQFPSPEEIPETMEGIVEKFNSTSVSRDHNPYYLASWLLHEILNCHPFVDGNGRLSRLLWCFSLLQDGLPFPLVPFPKIKKGYRHYIYCIERDRRTYPAPLKFMNSLTIISLIQTWHEYLDRLPPEQRQEWP